MPHRIAIALKEAMKAQDATRVSTLRLVMAALRDREIAGRGDPAWGEEGSGGQDEGALLAVLAKMLRQREDSVRSYEEAGRLDLAAREQAEMAVIREFMPRPMTEAEVEAAVAEAVAETDAHSLRDMGRVMGALKARYQGRMDFAKAGAAVKAALH
ncbi:MAG: GatB/YqeY domain-containing protein [Rhodobacteraceae bacterium]|nr:MAG: GatB/YqeY domain-containing protein [Paracoccaceae bacterium]